MLVLPRAERPFAKGPYLAFLIMVVATEPWRQDTYFEGTFDGVVIAKALLSVVGVFVAWWLVRNRTRRQVYAWPFVLVGLYLASTVFGGWADELFISSAVIAIRVAILMLAVGLLLSGYDGYSVMAGLVGALATVAAFSVLTAFGHLRDGRLAGGIPPLHPNEIAGISAVVILWLLYRAVNGRENGVDLLVLLVAVGALIASGSRTSLAMVVPAALVLLVSTRRVHLRVLIPFLLALPVLAAGLLLTNTATEVITREGSAEELLSLSNRTIAWQAALAPKDSPWLTWFGGGLSLKQIEVPGQWWSHQILDSSWVSAVVQGGLIGLGLCLVLVVYGTSRIVRTPGELRGFRMALVTFLALRGLLESGMFDASTAFLVLFTALALPDAARTHPLATARQRAILQPSSWTASTITSPGGNMRGIKNRLLVAGNLLALGLVVAGLVNFFAPRIYESTASLYATAAGQQLRATDIYQGTMMVSARMNTYVALATSPVVLNSVIDELSLDESPSSLAERVKATNPAGTSVLQVTAADPDPAQAQLIAATVATKFSDSLKALESAGTTAQVDFKAVSPAQPPGSPSSPDQLRNLLVGGLIGGGLGLLVLLWPLVRIASSPDGQLRIVLLGPLADRLDPSAVQIVGTPEPDARTRPALSAASTGAGDEH